MEKEYFLARWGEKCRWQGQHTNDPHPEDASSLESLRKGQIAQKKVAKNMRPQLTGEKDPLPETSRKMQNFTGSQEKQLEPPC